MPKNGWKRCDFSHIETELYGKLSEFGPGRHENDLPNRKSAFLLDSGRKRY